MAHPGVDLASVAEVRSSIHRFGDRYLRRVHTAGELAATEGMSDIRRDEFLAGRLAAKEAVLKALRIPRDITTRFQLVEVLPTSDGWPEVHLHGELASWAADHGITHCEVSVTHDDHNAIAFATAW